MLAQKATILSSRCGIQVRAFRQRTRLVFLKTFNKLTTASRGRKVAPDWGSRLLAVCSLRMATASICARRQAPIPPSPSSCRFGRPIGGKRHEQTHTRHRGYREQSTYSQRSAHQCRFRGIGGCRWGKGSCNGGGGPTRPHSHGYSAADRRRL